MDFLSLTMVGNVITSLSIPVLQQDQRFSTQKVCVKDLNRSFAFTVSCPVQSNRP